MDVFQSAGPGRAGRRLHVLDDPALARQQVDDDEAAAAIIIPAGFTDSIIPAPGRPAPASCCRQIELYTNPDPPTSAGVVKTILEEFLSQVEVGRVGGQVAVTQLLSQRPDPAAGCRAHRGRRSAHARPAPRKAAGRSRSRASPPAARRCSFDILAYMAPGMALMFLMFTVSQRRADPAGRARPGHPAAPAGLAHHHCPGAGRQDVRHLT